MCMWPYPPLPLTLQDTEEEEGEAQELLAADYLRAEFLRDRLVPKAVLFFTGEALDDDGDEVNWLYLTSLTGMERRPQAFCKELMSSFLHGKSGDEVSSLESELALFLGSFSGQGLGMKVAHCNCCASLHQAAYLRPSQVGSRWCLTRSLLEIPWQFKRCKH